MRSKSASHFRGLARFGTTAALLSALFGGGLGCGRGETKPLPGSNRGPPAFPVEVKRLAPERVEYAIDAVGAVEAFESVQITARVAGAIDAVRFREGDKVEKGALLVEIEPQRYQLSVAQAKASVARADAARAEAERELDRAQKLQTEGIGTSMEVSSWQTRLASAEAEASQARAALNLAALNLQDSRVRAPIAGTIQTRNVETGRYAQAGTVLATLIDRDPLLLRFKVDEREAARLSLGQRADFRVRDDATVFTSKVNFIAAVADAGSRMVAVVAEVEGEAPTLRPGTFAEVRVPIGASEGAVVVPDTSVRPSERGLLAYVVEGEVARERVLSLGLRTPDGRVEVKSGLAAGDFVVVRGAEALRDGAKVSVKKAGGGPPPPGGASASVGARP